MKKIRIILNKIYAYFLYCVGKTPAVSTFIDEDTITMGYGHCDKLGDFKFPLSKRLILKHYKTTSWNVRIENYKKQN